MIDDSTPNIIERLTALIGATSLGFIWFALLAVWGGTASYLTRIRKMNMPFSLMELIGEWSVSAFAGIITAFVCVEIGFSFFVTAAMAGIAGHMGGRAIALIEQAVVHFWKKRTGIHDEDRAS